MPPRPRADVYRAFWMLAAERQRIFFRRLDGEPPPWTADGILREYRFCNAYRASDRVSQYLIRNVIYSRVDRSAEDLVLRIVLFRLFSRPETWEALETAVGDIAASTFDPEMLAACLDERMREKRAIYTNAFILCANPAFGHKRKHRNHLALVERMLHDGLPESIAKTGSLEELYRQLLEYPLIGPFMAYQLAIDINYSELVDFDESSFTVPGPGALRGIRKAFESLGGLSLAQAIHWMTENQAAECARLGIELPDLWGRPLQAIDCQNLFCELDKYARVEFPDLRSDRVRIKSRFTPAGQIARPFYPPKWGLNERIAQSLRKQDERLAA